MDGDLMGNYSDSMFMHNVRSNENKKHQLKKSVHVFLNSLLQAIFSWPLSRRANFRLFQTLCARSTWPATASCVSTPKVIILQATTFPFFPTDETKGKGKCGCISSYLLELDPK